MRDGPPCFPATLGDLPLLPHHHGMLTGDRAFDGPDQVAVHGEYLGFDDALLHEAGLRLLPREQLLLEGPPDDTESWLVKIYDAWLAWTAAPDDRSADALPHSADDSSSSTVAAVHPEGRYTIHEGAEGRPVVRIPEHVGPLSPRAIGPLDSWSTFLPGDRARYSLMDHIHLRTYTAPGVDVLLSCLPAGWSSERKYAEVDRIRNIGMFISAGSTRHRAMRITDMQFRTRVLSKAYRRTLPAEYRRQLSSGEPDSLMEQIVMEGMLLKFSPEPHHLGGVWGRRVLKGTGDADIQMLSQSDTLLGVDRDGHGANIVGRCLMAIRRDMQ